MVAVTVPRRTVAGVLVAVAGLAVAAVAGLAAPLAAPPLYDGVVVVAPYVWVAPPAGKPGGAKGASTHVAISGHASPFVAVATAEEPPQAQLIAPPLGLTLPAGTSSLDVSITPLDPSTDVATTGSDRALGNIYRVGVVNQAGLPATAPASAYVSVVLRAPESPPDASLAQFVDGTWRRIKTDAGYGNSYAAVVTTFGDFAVVTATASPSPASPSPSPSASAGASATATLAPSPPASVPSSSGAQTSSPAAAASTVARGDSVPTTTWYLVVAAGLASVAAFAIMTLRDVRRR
jgi:hypothetical protein